MKSTKAQQTNTVDVGDNKKQNFELNVYLDKTSRKSMTYFEDLSNELIYDVFEYLEFFHLYNAFFNLNKRFTNLFKSTYFSFNINFSYISKTTFQHYYSNILTFSDQHQIKSLYLTNPFIINRLFIPIEKSLLCTRLEKLTFIDTDSKCLDEILMCLISFPHLISLVIVCIDPIEYINTFYRRIFRLPKLKYLKLTCVNSMLSLSLSIATSEFSPITYLVIDHSIDLNDLNILLSYVPQLRRLKLNHLLTTSFRPIKLHSVMLKHLTHVSIKTDISFNEFQCLIQNGFHQIQVLYVANKQDKKYLDAQQWKQLIVSFMPHLRIFDINIRYNIDVNENILQYIQQIDQFKSSFWIERKWLFEYQFRKYRLPNCLFFYSTNPYRRKYFTLYEENDETTSLSHTKTNLYSVNQIDIQNITDSMICGKYFPNATELTMSNGFVTRISHSFFAVLNQIIPMRQLTTLSLYGRANNFVDMFELLVYTPTIHTIIIHLRIDPSDLIELQQSETFRLVSQMNNIRKVTLAGHITLTEIKFFVKLCPRLEHLTLFASIDDLKQAVPFLFSKKNTNTRCLSSIYMASFEQDIEILRILIESEKLVNNSLIDVDIDIFGESLYLWR